MPGPGSIKTFRKKRPPMQERPCPICYRVMVWVRDGEWECVKHGKPTRP